MTIQRITQTPTSIITETWYIAQHQVPTRYTSATNPTKATATGYGTTHYGALVACMRDINKINSL